MCIFLFLTFTCLVRFAPVWEQVIRKYEVTFIIREREFLIIILQMLRYADVAKDVQVCRRGEVWRCAGVQMWRCAGVQMWRCADMEMWRCAGVEMCRCGDVQLCADVKEVKMRKKWRCEGSEDVQRWRNQNKKCYWHPTWVNPTIQNTGPIRSYLRQNSPQGRLIRKWSWLCMNLDKCDPSLTMKLHYIPPALHLRWQVM